MPPLRRRLRATGRQYSIRCINCIMDDEPQGWFMGERVVRKFSMAAGMRGARTFCAIAWLAASATWPATAGASELLPALHGTWRGDGVQILIDTERMQGNVDPRKPFSRDPLVIRDVTPPWVVFAIGISTFVAKVEGETMTVTQPGWPAPRILARVPGSRRAPARTSSP